MKKKIFFLMTILLIGNFYSCEDKDPVDEEIPFLPELSVVIDGLTLDSWNISTTITAPDGKTVGLVAGKGYYGIIIHFPAYCGKKTFNLSETDEAKIFLNRTEMKNGELSITKYIEDEAFARGKFKFKLTNDSIHEVSGTFSMTHPSI